MESTVLSQADFPGLGRQDWERLARKAIGETPFDDALVSATDDGIRIDPLQPRVANAQRVARLKPDAPWHFVQRIDDTDPARANAQALEDIAQGATGLAIVFEGAPNAFGHGLPATQEAFQRALQGVPLNRSYIRIDVHPQSRQSVDWLVRLFVTRKLDPARLTLAFGIDPAALFAGTGRLRMSLEALRASMPQSLAHFFALGVPGALLEADGRVLHNAGATEAQELGFMLSAALSHLKMFEEARQPLVYAAPHIGFVLSVDQDQLVSTAKIRALRKLWHRVQEACAIEPSSAAIHAETSWRMLTKRDPENNILRNTIAAFAAAAGGADSLSILPHTLAHGLPDAFARRVARNTQLILSGESRLDFVSDPGRGSGGVEALTDGLCREAWAEFQKIEAEGGALQSLADGHVQKRVAQARAARVERYASGRSVIVGATLFPAGTERPVNVLPSQTRAMPDDGTVFCEQLAAARIDTLIGAE